jgi:uncharacterized membrane protein YfcA
MIEMVIALAIVGAVAGVIAGLFGVGGGMILVPAFYYAFTTLGYAHQDLMQICLATSLATIVVTSLRSLSAHNKRGGVDWDVLRTWAPGIMIGALVSVAFAAQLRSSTLQWIFGGLGMCIGLYMAFGKTGWRVADDMPTGLLRAIYSPLVGFFFCTYGHWWRVIGRADHDITWHDNSSRCCDILGVWIADCGAVCFGVFLCFA